MHRMLISSKAVACAGLLLLGTSVGNATGQTSPLLSRTDSVRVATETFGYVLRLANIGSNQRIWLRIDTTAESADRLRMAPHTANAIVASDGRVRIAPLTQELFRCPAGKVVRMPSSGCPILESGVIVTISQPRVAGDSLIIDGEIIQSSARPTTWAVGVGLIFRWVSGAWKYERELYRSQT